MAFQNKDELLRRHSDNVMGGGRVTVGLSKYLSPPGALLDSTLFVLPLFLQSQDIFSEGSTQRWGKGDAISLMIQHTTLVATQAHSHMWIWKWCSVLPWLSGESVLHVKIPWEHEQLLMPSPFLYTWPPLVRGRAQASGFTKLCVFTMQPGWRTTALEQPVCSLILWLHTSPPTHPHPPFAAGAKVSCLPEENQKRPLGLRP